MSAIEMVFGGFIVGVILLCLYAHARSEASKPRSEPVPKLPELVCTCGDCWEIPIGSWKFVECGCGINYTVLADDRPCPAAKSTSILIWMS